MRWSKIKGVLLQELYVTRSSFEVIFDIFIFSLSSLLIFGFISRYLSAGQNVVQAQNLLIALLFWEVIRINQYSTSVSSMWNIWSHNMSNMFIAPLKVSEYVMGHVISASVKSAAVFIAASALCIHAFKVDVLALGIGNILFAYLNMVIFATAIGLMLIGLVFQHGTRIQALTWGLLFILQPFFAIFYPLSALPDFMRYISCLFPVTFFFEWLRALNEQASYSHRLLFFAFIFNLIWLAVGIFIFSKQIASSKKSGQLARNDL